MPSAAANPSALQAERPINLESLQLAIAELEHTNATLQEADRDLSEPLACAATLAEFDPTQLLSAFDMAADSTNLLRVQAHARQNRRGGAASATWRLTHSARRQALSAIDETRALWAIRQRMEVQTPSVLQRMADQLLAGAPIQDFLAIGELAALVEAYDWYHGILPQLPDPEMLRRRLALAQLLEPMKRLVGDHFVGRKSELDRLADYVGILKSDSVLASIGVSARRFVRRTRRSLLSDPPLFVAGPGGVGKSSLMARFILDHVDLARGDPIPFVLVDFDRAQVEPTLPLSLLLAALQQLRVQFPAHADAMARMSESLVQRMRVSDRAEHTKSHSLQETVVMDFARQVDTMLGGASDPTPLLWILDTFEEPQRLGDSTVGPLWELMDSLQRHLPRLRLVVCGRVAPAAFRWDLVLLEDFDAPSALVYLRHRLSQIGASERADDATLSRVIGLAGRSPLVLRLAARLIAEEDPKLLMLKVGRERILGVLFHRVLEHIRVYAQLDPQERVDAAECSRLQDELGRLVFPGLAVRRITTGVIQHVLAKPCAVVLRDAGHAERLFKALRQQVDIVEPGADDGDEPSLLHLSVLRRMMLRDLESKAGIRTVQRIARRAVRYHQSLPSVGHRAEELYHRLRLNQAEATIRGRWIPEVQPYLLGALEEMDRPSMRVLLANLLGVTLDADALKNTAQDGWELQAERRVAQYLRAGNPEQAIEVLNERPQRLPASPLLGLEAQARHLQGNFNHAAALARRAFDESSLVGDMVAACDAVLLQSLAEEAGGTWANAQAQTEQGLELARQLGDPILLLRANVSLVRLRRQLGWPDDALEDLVQEINATLDTDILRELRDRPALLRELMAELAARNRRLMRVGIDVLGVDLPSPDDAHELATTLELWARQAPRPEMVNDTAQAFGVTASANGGLPTVGEWQDWLWMRGADNTRQLLLALLRTLPPDDIVAARLAKLYQREVHRRIVRAVAARSL